jgi:hypothetical protein
MRIGPNVNAYSPGDLRMTFDGCRAEFVLCTETHAPRHTSRICGRLRTGRCRSGVMRLRVPGAVRAVADVPRGTGNPNRGMLTVCLVGLSYPSRGPRSCARSLGGSLEDEATQEQPVGDSAKEVLDRV